MAAAAVVSSALGLRAVLLLRRDRAAAFRLLRLSLLVSLLFGQVFTFVVNQFAAVTALAVALLLVAVVRAESDRPAAAGDDHDLPPVARTGCGRSVRCPA